MNDTVGPSGLVPTLLVFRAYPRLTELDPPSPSIIQYTNTIKHTTQEVAKLYTTRKVKDTLHQCNRPQTQSVYNLELGSQVLVWRIHEKKWTGLHQLLSVGGETATIEVNSRPIRFRTTIVRPYLQALYKLTRPVVELPAFYLLDEQIPSFTEADLSDNETPDTQLQDPITDPDIRIFVTTTVTPET